MASTNRRGSQSEKIRLPHSAREDRPRSVSLPAWLIALAAADVSFVPATVHVGPETHIETGPRYPVLDAKQTCQPLRRKRKHHTSSDSSLLEVCVRPKLDPPTGSDLESEHAAQREVSDRTRKRRRTEGFVSEAITSASISSTPKQETFEKRARHKTREDRYESKKTAGKRAEDGHDKKPRKKKEKRGDRKKAAKKAGEDLMRNFSSKSIGQERLTVSSARAVNFWH